MGATEHLNTSCTVFPLQLHFFFQPGLLPLLLPCLSMGHLCLSLFLITVSQSPVFIFTSSSFPTAFCSFPGHSITLSHLSHLSARETFSTFCCNCFPVVTSARMSLRKVAASRTLLAQAAKLLCEGEVCLKQRLPTVLQGPHCAGHSNRCLYPARVPWGIQRANRGIWAAGYGVRRKRNNRC